MNDNVVVTVVGNKLRFYCDGERTDFNKNSCYKKEYSVPSTNKDIAIDLFQRSKRNLNDRLFSIADDFDYFVTVRYDFEAYEYMRAYRCEYDGENLLVLPEQAWREAQVHRDRLMLSFKRKFKKSAAVWVMELGNNQGPLHYHFYVKDNHGLSSQEIDLWFYDRWSHITGQFEERLVNVKQAKSQNGMKWYTTQKKKALYQYPLHLNVPFEEPCGNTYGIVGSKNLTFIKPKKIVVKIAKFEEAIEKMIKSHFLYCAKNNIPVNEKHVKKLRTSRSYNHICGDKAQEIAFWEALNLEQAPRKAGKKRK